MTPGTLNLSTAIARSGRSPFGIPRLAHAALLTLALLLAPCSRAQPEAPAASPPAPVTPDQVRRLESRLLEVEPAVQDQVSALLEAATARLTQFSDFQAAISRAQQEIDSAPASLDATRAALAAPAPDPAASAPPTARLAELQRLLSQAQAQLEASRGQLTTLEAEPAARQRRRDAIPAELADAQRALEAAEADAGSPPPDDAPPLLIDARALASQAAVQAARARVQSLQRELASLDARRENAQARADLARRQVGEAEALVRHLESRVNDASRAAAQEAAEAARLALEEAASSSPLVQAVLESTQQLAARRASDSRTGQRGAQDLASQAEQDARDARAALTALADDYRSTVERVETIGLTDTMGRLLREKRRRLESPLDLEGRIDQDRQRRGAALLELFELRPLRDQWGEPAAAAQAQAAAVPGLSPEERTALQVRLQQVMIARQAAYRDLLQDLERYQQALGELDAANRARLTLLRQYIQDIDRTILWVPSHHPVNQRDLSELAHGFAWLHDARAWNNALSAPDGLLDDLRERPVSTFGPLLLALLLLLVARPWVSRITDRLHDRAKRVGTDSFSLTIRALLLGVLIASVGPLILLALSVILFAAGDAAEQARAVAVGFRTAAGILFAMLVLRRLNRRGGLAEVHFRWPEPVTASIRSKLRWITPLALATYPLAAAAALDPDTPGGPAVARLALVVWLIGLSFALYRLLRPHGPAIAHFLKVSPGGWIDRLRYLWYPLAFAAPLALATIALLGYIETARELESRFLDTLGLILALILVAALVTRWITLARRRVAMEAARRRREALSAEHAKALGADTTQANPAAVDEQHGANLEDIDTQTRQLLRFGIGLGAIFGIWALWVGVLPALGMLERIQLWPTPRVVEQPRAQRPWEDPAVRALTSTTPLAVSPTTEPAAATAPPATPTATPPPPSTPAQALLQNSPAQATPDAPVTTDRAFTLADLLKVLVLALGTLVAARNIPGVSEIVLLQHLPLDRGARYAITTIFRYTILILGVSATLNAVGIQWGSVQWLAAALTFGLGFGLQEIFANFVSGVIILAERPIRIGDTVTVNNVTGNVSKIRMRATTIVDYDKRELIVPNRAFITDSVINWSLTDPTTRVVIPVTVALATDVNTVRDALSRAGKMSTYLVEGREPMALMRGVGPAGLNFELRFWIRTVEESHLALDEGLRNVERLLREAKVQISLPMQDINIRSVNFPPPPPPPSATTPTR